MYTYPPHSSDIIMLIFQGVLIKKLAVGVLNQPPVLPASPTPHCVMEYKTVLQGETKLTFSAPSVSLVTCCGASSFVGELLKLIG